jgi:uncharacterized membrane protein YgcG
MPNTFGAEEEAYAYRTGRAAPAPPSIVGQARSILTEKLRAANLVNNQQRIATGRNVPQASGVGYRAPISNQMAPVRRPVEPEPRRDTRRTVRDYENDNSIFRPFGAEQPEVMTGFDLYTKDREKTTLLYQNMTPEQQAKAEAKSRENRQYLATKEKIVRDVENIQGKDANLPIAEREALNAIKLELAQMRTKDVLNELNPVVVALKNLGTRAQYRIEQAAWKQNKKSGSSMTVPQVGLPTTGEEFDEMGGLGGFLTQSNTSKTADDFDRTPAIFGKLITRDANGVESIISAEDWIAARIADTKPLPNDTPDERRRKERLAADWISTLAFADKYNSFAQKRDAGYRVQLDSNGNPVRAYLLKPDEDALKNLTAEILTDMATHNVVGPIEDWIQAYAESRDEVGDVATGVYGNGQDSGSSGSGRGYGYGGGYGGGGYGGGGDSGGATLTDPELLKMSIDSIARARMGRSLTQAESLEFINYFHEMEKAFVASRMNGADASRLDPEAQAVAWIESRMTKESAGQQAGQFIQALMAAIRSGNFGAN